MYLRLSLWAFTTSAVIEFISILELYQIDPQQLHILIIKVVLSPKNTVKFKKKYGCRVLKIILLSLLHTYQENTISKETSFLEH